MRGPVLEGAWIYHMLYLSHGSITCSTYHMYCMCHCTCDQSWTSTLWECAAIAFDWPCTPRIVNHMRQGACRMSTHMASRYQVMNVYKSMPSLCGEADFTLHPLHSLAITTCRLSWSCHCLRPLRIIIGLTTIYCYHTAHSGMLQCVATFFIQTN
jgi:hypothetical protein